MVVAKKRSNVREIPEGFELRGHRLRLYPTREQVAALEAMQEEMRRAWNLLVGWRWAHADACVVRAEKDGVVGPEPERPEAVTDENRSEALEAEWKAYARALGERRFSAIGYATKQVPGYGFMKLGLNSWEYGALREWTVEAMNRSGSAGDRVVGGSGPDPANTENPKPKTASSMITSVCSAHQYQALIRNFMRAKRPKPRRVGESMPLQVMSGQCYVRGKATDVLEADGRHAERTQPEAYASILFSGLRIRAREPYRRARALRRPDKGLRFSSATAALDGVAITRETDGWYGAVRLVVPERQRPGPTIAAAIGVAVGLDVLCATSTGRLFRNVRRAETTERIAERQRQESMSGRENEPELSPAARRHAMEVAVRRANERKVGAFHARTESAARQQTRLSRRVRQIIESDIVPYLAQYQTIVIAPDDVTDLREMAQGPQTRLTPKGRGGYVSAMGLLLAKIRALGEDRVREVEWPGISRTCSRCGKEDKKAWRWRETPEGRCECGHVEHRRINAARNVLGKYLKSLEPAETSMQRGHGPEVP